MIFYFSGTGNSRWIAQELAKLTNDTAYDITTLLVIPNLEHEQQIGFIFPIYAWGVPKVMMQFVEKLKKVDVFTYAICTCGQDAGNAMKQLSKYYFLNSSYSVVMPNNYIIGSDTDSVQEIYDKIDLAKQRLIQIAKEITLKECRYEVNEGGFSKIKSSLINFGFNHFACTTKPFYVTNKCNGCGKCVTRCPCQAIHLENKQPVWHKNCYQCMRCINECKQQAIEYGKKTKNRKRYTIDQYL